MGKASKIQKAAISLISKHFGPSTAKTYSGFFADEPDSKIITSISEIMVDYLGEESAKEEIKKFMENLNL